MDLDDVQALKRLAQRSASVSPASINDNVNEEEEEILLNQFQEETFDM